MAKETIQAQLDAIEAEANKQREKLKTEGLAHYEKVKSEYEALTAQYQKIGWVAKGRKAAKGGSATSSKFPIDKAKELLANGKMTKADFSAGIGKTVKQLGQSLRWQPELESNDDFIWLKK